MQSSQPPRKIKITLSDYSFRRDIENRLLMAQLSDFEVKVLQEILHDSLRIPIEQLADTLNVSVASFLPVLDKLSSLKLFKRQELVLIVDREARKYFEFQIEKFDQDFEPNLDFLQNVLSKVPIPILPVWYAIPRSSDNIVASIIEKYLLTPEIYRLYISELQFDDPILHAIIRDVYQAPQFKITSSDLISKHKLSREQFEEYLMLLEYHFICYLRYNRIGDYWQEVVTPFSEWLEYLQFEESTKPIPIQGPIEKTYATEFDFINELTNLLHAFQDNKMPPQKMTTQCKMAMQKLLQAGFAQQSSKNRMVVTPKGEVWLSKPLHEQITNLAVDPSNTLANMSEFESLWNIRNLRLIEKSLKRLTPNEWVTLDDFLKGFITPIGNKELVTLKNKGKKWKYVIPSYTEQEKQFIKAVIMERLSELGVVLTGFYQGIPCFCLTKFGNHFIH